jgi:hypothetical protein
LTTFLIFFRASDWRFFAINLPAFRYIFFSVPNRRNQKKKDIAAIGAKELK